MVTKNSKNDTFSIKINRRLITYKRKGVFKVLHNPTSREPSAARGVSRRQREVSDVISSYQFVNEHRLEEDRVSKSSFSPVNKETLQKHYQGFKGLNEQL